eukprot:UN01047
MVLARDSTPPQRLALPSLPSGKRMGEEAVGMRRACRSRTNVGSNDWCNAQAASTLRFLPQLPPRRRCSNARISSGDDLRAAREKSRSSHSGKKAPSCGNTGQAECAAFGDLLAPARSVPSSAASERSARTVAGRGCLTQLGAVRAGKLLQSPLGQKATECCVND